MNEREQVADRERLLELVRAATAALERNRQRIDDLNVYPVPDGDTGTNLLLTARAVVEALERSDAAERPALARETVRAALMGARGNSGVILSQLVRGAADVLGAAPAVETRGVAAAFRGASDAAYRAVRRPVEGTMLTVARELAEEAEAHSAEGTSLAALVAHVVRRGEDAVARTPEQLAVLRDAGVVDAGGAGLLELVRGLAAALAGEPLPEPAAALQLSAEAVHQEQSRFRYCTAFVVEGHGLDATAFECELEPLGDSVLVVGDETALKAHVHTDDPGAALSLATRLGTLEGVEIADMHRQAAERERRLLHAVADEPARCDVVAVVAGEGNRRLFESLGAARIVSGGQSMNPPAAALADAIDAASADEVVVLPNNSNVVMTAQQAAELAQKPARVVPTRTLQAGLAAMVAYDGSRSAAENAEAMADAASELVTGAVALASRDAELNGVAVRKGEYVGLLDGEPVSGGDDLCAVARGVVERLLAEPRGVLTMLTGADAPPVDALLRELAERHPDVEVEVHAGGQPHYPLLLSAE